MPSPSTDQPARAPFSPPPSSHAPHAVPSSAAVDEDDLLALLNNDFAIDSKRDRELVVLSSFLKGVLPPAGGAVAHPLPPALTSNVTIGNAATAQHLGGWNGWRPNGEGIAAPFGSPMSFASTSSAMSGMPPGPSTSFGSAFSPSSLTSGQHHFASPKNTFAGLPSNSPAQRSPFGRAASSSQQLPPGARAPACSRERVPTLATFGQAGSTATADPEEGGWKTRLRSSKPRPSSADRSQQIAPTTEEDVMME
ncbi:hypothetical protein JCM10908_003211 [Rhodotorula pacifica]|uniref:uncharacterized protein n=1 Tax=Rhodotorula pacifica TaxID=1495444 RepID=UPI00317C8CEA